MKIGQFDPKTAPVPTTERKPQPAAQVASSEPSATVDLSSSATLRAQGRGEASFDQSKVDRITAAIRDGNYKVDAGAIADKLIANAEELLKRPQR